MNGELKGWQFCWMYMANDCTHHRAGVQCSFYSFPKDPEYRRWWAAAVNRLKTDRKPWERSAYSRLCGCHFTPEQLLKAKTRFIGRSNTVPTLFSHKPPVTPRSTQTCRNRLPPPLPRRKRKLDQVSTPSPTTSLALGPEGDASVDHAAVGVGVRPTNIICVLLIGPKIQIACFPPTQENAHTQYILFAKFKSNVFFFHFAQKEQNMSCSKQSPLSKQKRGEDAARSVHERNYNNLLTPMLPTVGTSPTRQGSYSYIFTPT
jgi:hypothetical protein